MFTGSRVVTVNLIGILLALLSLVVLESALPLYAQDEEEHENLREIEKHHEKYRRDHTDSQGRLRPDLMLKARQYVRHMKIAAGIRLNPGAAMTAGLSPITGVQWNQIGPAPNTIDVNPNVNGVDGAGPDSGEIVDIAIDPRGTADKVIYVATNDGGIWKTTDGGTTWTPKTDYLPSLSMGAVALDPNNPSIVYAGTSNPFDGSGRYCCGGSATLKAAGMYKSVDGGDTWSVLNPITFLQPTGIFTGLTMNRIVVLPSNSNAVLVATSNGLYRSADGGQNWGTSPNFNDGKPILAAGTFISDLKVDTANGSTVYAAVTGLGILESTDGGVTFPTNLFTTGNPPVAKPNTPATGQFLNITMAQSISPNNQSIYALVISVNNQGPNNGNKKLNGLYKSTDGGNTWAQILPYDWVYCQCGYDNTVGVDPQDPNRVYVGFVNLFRATDGGAKAGSSFTLVGGSDIHDDNHAVYFSPRNHWPTTAPTPIFVGTDGGISYSTQGGDDKTWTNNNGNLATNLFFTMDMGRNSADNNNYMYGGLQDQGVPDHRKGMALGEWHLNTGGDGFAAAVDPANGANAYGRFNNTTVYTTDGGKNWTTQTLAGLPAASNGTETLGTDPNNGQTVFTTQANQLCRGNHSGNTITFTCFPSGGFSSNTSFVVATTPIDSTLVWVGLANGKVARINNALSATPTVTEYSVTGAPAASVGGIAIDPSNTANVVVVYTGFTAKNPQFSTQHVFMTTDNGTTWKDITGVPNGAQNLPDLPLNSVVIDPGTSPHTIIVSSDVGVLRTVDQGRTWQVYGVGFPATLATALALDTTSTPSLLRVSTYGRSVLELDAANGPLLAINGNLGFGRVCLGSGSKQILQLFNVGSTTLSVNSVFVASGSSDFQVSGPATPVNILPGGEIDFTVTFTPSSGTAGTIETATIQINSNDQFQPVRQVPASATIGAGTIGTSIADSGNFGGVCIGSFADLPITINNSGTCSLNVNSILSTDPEFLTPSTTFPVSVAAGASVQLEERFQPTLPAGPKTSVLTVQSDDPVNPNVSINVSGVSQAPVISVSGTGAFGNVCAGTTKTETFKVCNLPQYGLCSLQVQSATLNAGCKDFTITSNPFPAVLGGDACADLTVQFTPTSDGAKTCNLIVTSNDPATPIDVVPLTGTTPIPSISLSTALAFPPVVEGNGKCAVTQPFPVRNTGICPLTVTGVTLGPVNPEDYALNDLPQQTNVIPPGGALSQGGFGVRFQPVELNRNVDSAVDVTYISDPILGTRTTLARNLCGEGVFVGARVLVTLGGVPVSTVDRIQLIQVSTNTVIDNVVNATLKTITPKIAKCTPFQFQREYGTVSDPKALTPGTYQVKVTLTIAGKQQVKTATFNDNSCGFAHPVVVAF
jgi:photosystem II stability/assembly factor-like uncharacterized protein